MGPRPLLRLRSTPHSIRNLHRFVAERRTRESDSQSPMDRQFCRMSRVASAVNANLEVDQWQDRGSQQLQDQREQVNGQPRRPAPRPPPLARERRERRRPGRLRVLSAGGCFRGRLHSVLIAAAHTESPAGRWLRGLRGDVERHRAPRNPQAGGVEDGRTR